jgi:hypothetical protein
LIKALLQKRLERWKAWYRAPVTTWDRFLGMLVGGVGFFWIGVLVLCVARAHIESTSSLLVWFAVWVGAGSLVGGIYPKVITVVCFPLATFGPGP